MTSLIKKLYEDGVRIDFREIRKHIWKTKGDIAAESIYQKALKAEQAKKENASQIQQKLSELFSHYKTDQLKNITSEELQSRINSKIGETDGKQEGFEDYELEQQRDFAIRFAWGHDHDFGDFFVQGMMRDRHLSLMANFWNEFDLDETAFKGKKVLDVGCWTGGTSLLLAKLGAEVTALEEVKKYADMASFLVKSFGCDYKVQIESSSIYTIDYKKYMNQFDVVYFPGVIYHLSDPVVALRILYNMCKKGGIILVETEGLNSEESYCKFTGSLEHTSGNREKLNRTGWNWFLPSPSSMTRMLLEAGFDDVKNSPMHGKRLFSYAKKKSIRGICKAGLSSPDLD